MHIIKVADKRETRILRYQRMLVRTPFWWGELSARHVYRNSCRPASIQCITWTTMESSSKKGTLSLGVLTPNETGNPLKPPPQKQI